MKKITVIRNARSSYHVIDLYCNIWSSWGFQVINHIGCRDIPESDLYILHIDLSVIPSDFCEAIKSLPRVLNGDILDIRKKRFGLILKPESPYTGPVLVKTNCNYGGFPEAAHTRSQNSNCPDRAICTLINPLSYPIFKSKLDVPGEVWASPDLIVQPFLNTKEGDLYFVNYYDFFGDKEFSGRIGSRNPIVKFSNSQVDEPVKLPKIVRHWRKKLKIDYGRIDYIQQGKNIFLLDVNKTEGAGDIANYMDDYKYLAEGVYDFL